MSLDYSDYEELRKKSGFLSILWQIGDKGYYLGLLGSIISPLATIYTYFMNRKANLTWDRMLIVTVILIGIFILIFFLSNNLKYLSVKWGKRLK